ncbi:MAG: translocation/assembly module TamB domain-containing protein [Gloeomargarita sp. SKYBB_i_bin120]|nr:translocation/assembly module TamB domain-containing protein [Gloeomargarita sp. SKYB120]MDW8178537.1 translocation/assembly module TamB domain-containing protein [Gloeomargarita sp. SKYBB_i_bin120]
MLIGLLPFAKTVAQRVKRKHQRWWLGGVVVLGTAGGLGWGANYLVREQLAPLIAQKLTRTLNRPVRLGQLERFGWTGVRFGASEIPATPTDPNYLRLQAIDVRFQPWQWVQRRRLDIQVHLRQPEVVLHQSADRRWLRLSVNVATQPQAADVQITQVSWEGGRVTLVPWASRRAQTYEQFQARIRSDANQWAFQGQAITPGAGQVRFAGHWQTHNQTLTAQIQTRDIPATPVQELVAGYVSLPARVSQGRISSDLAVQWQPGQRPHVTGPVQLQGWVVHSSQWPTVAPQLNARLHLTPEAVRVTQGQLQWAGVAAAVTGTVHFQQGYDLTAQVPPVALERMGALVGWSTPVRGQVISRWVVRGALAQPYIRGQLTTVGGLRLAQTQVEQATADMVVTPAGLDIPRFRVQLPGAQFQGSGRMDRQQRLAFQFQGQAQAEQLWTGKPLPVRIGTVTLQGRLQGTVQQPQVNLDFRAAQATVPLRGRIQWQKEQLQLQAAGEGLHAQGTLDTRTGRADLHVQVQQYDLKQLPLALPPELALRGEVDFQGRLTGTLTQPQVQGDVVLAGLRLNHWQFEPYLRGQLIRTPTGELRFAVQGVADRIAVTWPPGMIPQSLTVQRGSALIQGQGRDGRLALNFRGVPLTLFSNGLLQGSLQGAALWDHRQQRAVGQLQVEQARLGNLVATKLGGQFRWHQGELQLTDGELHQYRSRYRFSGQAQLRPHWRWQAQVEAVDAVVQDLAPALLTGKPTGAADLTVTPVGQPGGPLDAQLALFEQVQQQVQQYIAEQQQALGLPDVRELQGRWRGQATLTGNHRGELTATFAIQGRDWVWGPYRAERLTVQGRYEGTLQNGKWTLEPLQLVQGDGQLLFSGSVGGAQQRGQLIVTRLPVTYFTRLLPIPGDPTGWISGSATLAGSLANPQAKGEITIQDGTWYDTPIETARTSFSYGQGQLRFGSELQLRDTVAVEPVRASGTLPWVWPGSTVKPSSDQMALNVQVRDSGLRLVNSLTPWVQWLGGAGEVQMDVTGTWREPRVRGRAQFQGARVAVNGLAEPVQALTGEIRFLGDRLAVQDLQAQVNGGTLTLNGVLPISQPLSADDPDHRRPLTLALLPARIQQKDVYEGQASATLTLTGTAQKPVVGGVIDLSQGRLFISDAVLGGATKGQSRMPSHIPAEFRNLQIRLGQNLQVVRQPNLDVVAQGTLTLNGPVTQPQPQGTLALPRGEVNLFLTRFRLDRTHHNRVVFDPRYGFDPELDLRLTSTVTQGANQLDNLALQRRGRFPNEVPIAVGERVQGLETVRVQASINGRVSRLPQGLELTSSPRRTQEQIIALLGGFSGRSGNDAAPLFLTAVAGQTLLNQISRAHETDFGGISWRFFPTVLPVPPDRSHNLQESALALGGEVRLDIHRFSASFLQMFTSVGNAVSDPNLFQATLAYRINDQLRIRGSLSSDRDHRLLIEYSKQF